MMGYRGMPLVFAAIVLAYPIAVLAGGSPRFPSRADCVRPASGEGPVTAVLAYVDSEHEANRVREHAGSVGFENVEVQRDACGRVKVFVGHIPTVEVGRAFAEEARRVGFHVTLEQAP